MSSIDYFRCGNRCINDLEFIGFWGHSASVWSSRIRYVGEKVLRLFVTSSISVAKLSIDRAVHK